MRYLAFSLVGILALAALPDSAQAGGRGGWGISIGVGNSGYHSWSNFGFNYRSGWNNNWCDTPRYYGSYRATYYRLYPRVYSPPPVVYSPPVYCPPPVVYSPPPVVYSPPVYCPPPVVYTPRPYYTPQYYPSGHYYSGGYYYGR